MARMTGRLLAVSWATLPMSRPRAMQVCRLLAHLPEHGWKADVITSRECDDSPPQTAERTIAAIYDRRYARHEVEPREDCAPSGWITRVRRRMFPPASVYDANWIERAAASAARLNRRKPFDALATFAQPWMDHLIGLRVKKRRRTLPWLAHFSDPWVDSPYYSSAAPEDRAVMAAQERAVVSAADAVVFVTRQTADMVMEKYPSSWRNKVWVVPHGFDADILRQIGITEAARPAAQSKARLRIVHTGSLYEGVRPATGVLQALATLRDQGKDLPIELHFIGHQPQAFEQEIKRLALDDIVQSCGPRAWSESVAMAAAADVLLLIEAPGEDSVFLPSKLVEYLALRKPILGLTPDRGAASDLLRQFGYETAPPDDPAAIAARLGGLITAWRAGCLSASPRHDAVAAEYDMRHVAERFAAILAEMPGRRQAGSDQ